MDEKKKKKRHTVPMNVQVSPETAQAIRNFASDRGESIRQVLEMAIRRHIANPPPKLEIPPLPPVPVQHHTEVAAASSKPKKKGG